MKKAIVHEFDTDIQAHWVALYVNSQYTGGGYVLAIDLDGTVQDLEELGYRVEVSR